MNQQGQQQVQQQAQKPAATKPKHTAAEGKDISKKFKFDPSKGTSAVEQAAEAQGFLGKGRVVGKQEFEAAQKASGTVMYRTVNSGRDVKTGKAKSADDFLDDLKNGDKVSLNGSGGQVYGGGMYFAASRSGKAGTAPSKLGSYKAETESKAYGDGTSSTVAAAIDPSAKIGSYKALANEFKSLTYAERQRYGNDVGAYACAKGYDAISHKVYSGIDYIMVYNRTKVIFYENNV